MAGLSKSRVLLHRQCPKRLWLQVNRSELAQVSAGSKRIMDTGTQIGELAREFHPGGLLIDPPSLTDALSMTRVAMDEPFRPLFEATFEAGGILIRADLMLPAEEGYAMVEVKSSASVKDYQVDDAAMQAWVLGQCRVPLVRTQVAHIDTGFVYPGGGDYRGLLRYADVSDRVTALADEIPDWIASAKATLSGSEPDIEPGGQCTSPFECPFIGYCHGPDDPSAFPPEILPNGGKLAARLRSAGYDDLRDVPDGVITGAKHQRIWRVTRSGIPDVDAEAREIVRRLPFPRYYLDFETINPALPVWAGTRPYAQIPFQWSCHVEHADGRIEHLEFLADGQADPRRAFSESLVAAVDNEGPVVVYNASFERQRMEEMAEAFPDLAPPLLKACDRIFDLLPLCREHYYHPKMRGSWSIKAVLPTIAPDLDYSNLKVGDGGMAQEAFAEMMQADTDDSRRAVLREALLKYCERDTLAMVRILHFFSENSNDD